MPTSSRLPRDTLRGATASRRQGSVLVLVMTILGILFVTGMAFMASVSFEAKMIDLAREREQARPSLDDVVDPDDLLTDIDLPSLDLQTGGILPELPAISFAETPGLYNLAAPIEPYQRHPDPDNLAIYDFVYRWFTDLEALAGVSTGYRLADLEVDTAWISGSHPDEWGSKVDSMYPKLLPVDADGDGIADSMQVDLTLLGVDRAKRDALAKLVNPPTNPNGPVYIALRVVPHGGMVNLAQSHPTLIKTLFDYPIDPSEQPSLPQEEEDYYLQPYSPRAEEPVLRRRGGLLPPRDMPPTQIYGNPMDADPDAGGGDYGWLLFPPGESLDEHRYWPFDAEEYKNKISPDVPLWEMLMDPVNSTGDPRTDYYDRRHLVTTVSHDDLFRRSTIVKFADRSFDLVDLVVNKKMLAGLDPTADFPYVDYPSDIPNTYKGPDADSSPYDDLVTCCTSPDCMLNPRKGKLRLSLPWLEDAVNNGVITADEQKLLIQDVFTLMLLNARAGDGVELADTEWGYYETPVKPVDTNENLIIDPEEYTERVWRYNLDDFDAIAETAAALTANLLDFADDDGDPTEVQLREVNFASTTFGEKLTGQFVYGLERQPFITEVVAKVVEKDDPPVIDPASSMYGVELFNPYDKDIELGGRYFLRISGSFALIDLPGSIAADRFIGYHNGNYFGGSGTYLTVNNLVFDDTDKIELIRRVGAADVVVDEFDLTGTTVGKLGSDAWAERVAGHTNTRRWHAPIPVFSTTEVSDSFGRENGPPAPSNRSPVQAVIADTGTFKSAFPTTGSLLLLMRHANTEGEAFTGKLLDELYAVDNGRMPIFDTTDATSDPEHHVAPYRNPNVAVDVYGGPGLTEEADGDFAHLPWGQLVFDYFTALPLENDCPYFIDPDDHEKEWPRVDLDGLRVHGRINLNSAPWKVLQGIPFIPISRFPLPFQKTFREVVSNTTPWDYDDYAVDDKQGMPIGEELAKAIVAYREMRQLEGEDPKTGVDYRTGQYGVADLVSGTPDLNGRHWQLNLPHFRRGMGFLTVGELANVRHPDATGGLVRIDGLELTFTGPSYLRAVAKLVCLSDWVTVRSQVFTIYGTLRGDVDDTIPEDEIEERLRDVDSRAIRFQETVDRLPTFLGEDAPTRIGNRVLANYSDTRSD